MVIAFGHPRWVRTSTWGPSAWCTAGEAFLAEPRPRPAPRAFHCNGPLRRRGCLPRRGTWTPVKQLLEVQAVAQSPTAAPAQFAESQTPPGATAPYVPTEQYDTDDSASSTLSDSPSTADGWRKIPHKEHGHYWYNAGTGVSQWHHPGHDDILQKTQDRQHD